jgi:hypothetical protein
MHNLLERQKLYGKLFHAMLVIPAGQAHLTCMEAMLASFNDSPFILHTSPRIPQMTLAGGNPGLTDQPSPGPSLNHIMISHSLCD